MGSGLTRACLRPRGNGCDIAEVNPIAMTIPPPSGQNAGQIKEWLQLAIDFAKICGGFALGYFAHFLTVRRERQAGKASRVREFLAFMQAWRIEIDRWHLTIGGQERHPSAFLDSISEFRAAAEMVRNDFNSKKSQRFDELIARIPKYHPQKADEILKAIDEIVAHVESS